MKENISAVKIVIFFLFSLLFFQTSTVVGQSVAEIAARSRKEERPPKTDVITNRDLEKASGHISQSSVPSALMRDRRLTNKPDSAGAGEEHFLKRFLEQFQRIHRAEQRVETASFKYKMALIDYKKAQPVKRSYWDGRGTVTYWNNRVDSRTLNNLRAGVKLKRAKLENARRDQESAEREMKNLRQEARRNGIPPGVYRQAKKMWQRQEKT